MPEAPILETPRANLPEISRSEQARAASAHSRINIPLNLENWKHLPADIQQELLWFHQHLLDNKLSLRDAAEAINYDTSTVFRILKGEYEGSWNNISEAIRSYKRLTADRGMIQKNEFVENRITRLIFAGLSYALANNSITLITGESRMGKTASASAWRDQNNHGRSVLITAPPYGGVKGLFCEIAAGIGVSQNLPANTMFKAIKRAFNANRILIVDEAHRLLPGQKSNPVMLECLRDIHDSTKCGLALLATARFDVELKKSEYMYEQVLGRIGMPILLPKLFKPADILPIVRQYIPKPSEHFMTAGLDIANKRGRLGILVETLKVGSRMAAKEKTRMTDEHVFKALAFRREMSGLESQP
jgi:DNA transposition AAA+ family ATPase